MPDKFIRRGARLLPVVMLAPGLSAAVNLKTFLPSPVSMLVPDRVDAKPAQPAAVTPPVALTPVALTPVALTPVALTPEAVREAVLALGVKETRATAMKSLVAAAPKAELVALLSDASLALRVGALEALEELGGASTFDPWAPPGDAANADALARWVAWADADSVPEAPTTSRLDEDRRLAYLRDILSENDARARRAAEAFARDGDGSLVFLARYLRENPNLSSGLRARIVAVQYRILMTNTSVPDAGRVADALVFGDRDKLLGALESLRAGGRRTVPILADFLSHPEPLVRESACDIILVCGGAEAFPAVDAALNEETDPNVVQGALRSIPKIKTPGAYALVARHIAGKDEELALAAIRAAVNSPRPTDAASNKVQDDAVVVALGSPSWRVRAAALEYVASRRPKNSSEAVVKLLEDKDDFVRFSAMKAAAAMNLKPALGVLREMFLKDAALAPQVFVAYGSTPDAKIDDAMTAKLLSAESEYKTAVAKELRSYVTLIPIGLRLAEDADEDVACAALGAFASSESMNTRPEVSALLAGVLKSGSDARKLAIIRNLDLRFDSALLAVPEEPTGPTELDGLFDSFGDTGTAAAPQKKEDSLTAVLATFTAPGADAKFAVPVRLMMVKSGDKAVLDALSATYAELDTASRILLAERLPATPAGFPLATRLLRDPVDTVRAAATESMTSYERREIYRPLLLDESVRRGSDLNATQVYGYNFASDLSSPALRNKLRAWVGTALSESHVSTGVRVLALIACADSTLPLTHEVAGHGTIASLIDTCSKSSQAALRRAAWYARIKRRQALPADFVATLAGDPSPWVRELLPVMVTGIGGVWTHHFDDKNSAWDSGVLLSAPLTPAQSAEVVAAVRRLADSDPSPIVRNASAVALVALGEEVAPVLFENSGDLKDLEQRADRWLSGNYRNTKRAPRVFLELGLPHLYDEDAVALVRRRLDGDKPEPLRVTLGDYVAEVVARDTRNTGAASTPATVVASDVAAETSASPAEARPFVAVFFHKPGCRECARTREILNALRARHPEMTIEEHNILVPSAGLLNQVIASRLGVDSENIGVAPSVFTRGGMLARDRVNEANIAELLRRTSTLSGDDAWRLPEQGELSEAQTAVDERYAAITLGVVILAGLVDGINPCAFATIIFFLSYLRIARRSSREMWMTGWAFILGVFVAYFAAGLALHELIAQLDRFAWLQRGMNYVFGGLALLAAGFSVADAVRARRGRLDEMTLKLPKFLGDRVRKTIREGSKARAFVPAAFVTGITVSVIELACTGQVYAPIVYKIRQGDSGAVGMLLIYNLAFILPLVVLFIATWFGMKNDALLNFQKKHTFSVKLALAAVFLVLAVVIFTGV